MSFPLRRYLLAQLSRLSATRMTLQGSSPSVMTVSSTFSCKHGNALDIPGTEIDPSSKANYKLQTNNRGGKDYREAKTQIGGKMIDENNLDPNNIDYTGRHNWKKSTYTTILKTRKQAQGLLFSRAAVSWQRASFSHWEFWNGVKEHVHDAEDWVLDEIGLCPVSF